MTGRTLAVAMLLALAQGAAPTPTERLSDLVRLRLVDGVLVIDWLPAQPAPRRPMLVNGPEARWQVRSPPAIHGVVPGTLELERPPAGTRDRLSYWSILVSSSPDRLYLTAQRGGRVAVETTLRFTQTPDGAVHLMVLNTVNRTFAQARAASLVELRNGHPQLVRQFLVPLLRQISGDDPLLPGATDVYQVFAEMSPDERTSDAIDTLLPKLADKAFSVRERASAQLEALGPAGVCAALRIDRETLLPEQKLRLESLLGLNSHRVITDPKAARRDLSFLADCLEFDDERIRWIAKGDLEQILSRPIPLHHAPTPAEWSQAADLVRQRLAPR